MAAPLLARHTTRDTDHNAIRFHLLGILDLVVAASIAALVTSRLLDVTPSTEPLRLLPLALLPTAAVPLAVALHIVPLRHLGNPLLRSGLLVTSSTAAWKATSARRPVV